MLPRNALFRLARPVASRSLGKPNGSSMCLLRTLNTGSGSNASNASAVPTTSNRLNNSSCSNSNSSRLLKTATAACYSASVQTAACESPAAEEPIPEELLGVTGMPAASSSASSRVYGDGEGVLRRFAELKAERVPLLADYNAALKELAECRDFPRAWELYGEMRNGNVAPDGETYSSVLQAGRRTLRLNEIRQLFGEAAPYGREDSSAASTAVISPFYAQMQELVEAMRAANLSPSMTFYEDLANVLSTTNQAGVLLNLATALEKRGTRPSTKLYNRLLYCLPRAGLVERAGMLFNRMVLRGEADYYTYLTRASGLVYVGQGEAARQVISDAKTRFTLETVAFNILIKSHLEKDQIDAAVAVFKQMTAGDSKDIAPNRVTCRSFLSYFYETGQLAQAELIVKHFPVAGFPETSEDYANLIKFFARYDPPRALELMKEVGTGPQARVACDVHIYHAFMRILADRQVMPDWKRTFGALLLPNEAESTSPVSSTDANANASLLSVCQDLPFHFRELIRQMEASGFRPNAVTYEIVMRKYIQMRRFDAVSLVFAHLQEQRDLPVQSVHRNFQLTALLSTGQREAAADFVKTMLAKRAVVSFKNSGLLERMGMDLPRGLLTARGDGVSRQSGLQNTNMNASTSTDSSRKPFGRFNQRQAAEHGTEADAELNVI
jgi:pentatricopeptide repeat protein